MKSKILVFGTVLMIAALVVAGTAFARPFAMSGAPTLVNFQGFLTDGGGMPIDGTVDLKFGVYATDSGGTALWEETHSSVAVTAGYYSVALGSITPLDASVFSDTTRYMQVSVDTGGGYVDLNRQQLTSVPYALQAEEANMAASADAAPWSGLTGVPAGFADGIDDAGASYENVIIVAMSGGDFTSVVAATNSITDASSTNRYLVKVMAGVYTETDLVQVKEYVHLQGSGVTATVVDSARSGAVQNADSATVQLDDNAQISDLTVSNQGTGTYGIAIYSAEASETALIDGVRAIASGSGTGGGRFAAYMNDSQPTIKDSYFKAYGATGFGTAVNAALGVVNAAAGFPRSVITDSTFIGGASNDLINCNDNTGTGYGMMLMEASPVIRDSYICGGYRSVAVLTNGHPNFLHSQLKVSTAGGSFMFEINSAGSISVGSSMVFYLGNKFTGIGTGLKCVDNYDINFSSLTDGNTVATACN